ncbi:hypothetical protein MKZ38_004983 [Zalerion maritima]|uniref:Heterokaryon incompatibility domain-containing protein n=1 Tax=Zalerion maritima TaxID=339359 RepID=A0AAD5WQL4_9PEZI|nr:hypothetical protein MKZ38_004983 [Zalerion maritima]
MENHFFATVPKYEALSYHWGSAWDPHPISLNSPEFGVTGRENGGDIHECKAHTDMTRNCLALHHFDVWDLFDQIKGGISTSDLMQSPNLATLIHLLNRDWFEMVWVTQEAVISQCHHSDPDSPLLCCDTFQRPLIKIARLTGDVIKLGPRSLTRAARQALMRAVRMSNKTLWYEYPGDTSSAGDHKQMALLLCGSSTFTSTDNKDKLSSLLGNEIFYSYARKPITQTGSLELKAYSKGEALRGLPTWVPRWNAYTDRYKRKLGCLSSLSNHSIVIHDNVIQCRALRVGRIVNCGKPHVREEPPDQLFTEGMKSAWL